MQLILLCSYVGSPWSRFPASLPPPSGPTGLYTIDSLLSGNLDQFSRHYLALLALHWDPPQRHFERIVG